MSDGAFVARIAEEADCGILLDLHNIYCNERNGRITLDAFLADLPMNNLPVAEVVRLRELWAQLPSDGSQEGFTMVISSGNTT